MAICGDLKTMALVELLQWAGGNQKTGVLELERNKIRKRIAFKDGRIVGCATDDPSGLMGHFLISRGKISERTLSYALKDCESTNRRLSDALVDMGLFTDEEIDAEVTANAQETIYGLFEWGDAVFRFQLDENLDSYLPIELSVEHTLLNGAQRQDELQRIAATFSGSGTILERTERPLPANLEDGALVFPILALIDGTRTIAEVVLQAHATEFQVLKTLFNLQQRGVVEISGERALKGGPQTLIDARTEEESVSLPSLQEFLGQIDRPVVPDGERSQVADDTEPPASTSDLEEPADLAILMKFAADRLDLGDHEGALNMLDTCYRARPDDENLKRLMETAESAYLEKIKKYLLRPDTVPVLDVSPEDAGAASLNPMETTVLGMIDGKTNVQSIVWIAPLREVQVLRTLQQLHQKAFIQLESGADGRSEPAAVVAAGGQP